MRSLINMKKHKLILLLLVVLLGCTTTQVQLKLDKFNNFEIEIPKISIELEYGETLDEETLKYDLLKDGKIIDLNLPNQDELYDGDVEVITTSGIRTFKLKITDTQAPVILGPSEYEAVEGSNLDLTTIYSAQDPVDGDISVRISAYDTKKVGTHSITISAEDKHGNKEEKIITLKITKKVVQRPPTNNHKPQTGGASTGNDNTSNPGNGLTLNHRDKAIEMHNIVNKERQAAGLKPLRFNETLYKAAVIRAEEITIKFSHTRPNGDSAFTVAPGLMNGENISYGYSSPTSAVQGFMNSPGHRQNILNPSYSIGSYINGVWYWVQLFGN